MIEELKRKLVHGQFYQDLEGPSVYKEKSLVWLCSSALKRETESLKTTAQDQALNIHYHQRNIMKQLIVNGECAIRQKYTQNILLQDAQHLCHLNTLIDTIWWLLKSTG